MKDWENEEGVEWQKVLWISVLGDGTCRAIGCGACMWVKVFAGALGRHTVNNKTRARAQSTRSGLTFSIRERSWYVGGGLGFPLHDAFSVKVSHASVHRTQKPLHPELLRGARGLGV